MRRGGWDTGGLLLTIVFTAATADAGAAVEKIKFSYSPISWNSLASWMAKDADSFCMSPRR